MSAPGGSATRGVSGPGGGMSGPGGCLLLGGSASGGYLLPGVCILGVSAPGGGGVSQHALRQTPPVNRMTHRCNNITLATASLRPVIKYEV